MPLDVYTCTHVYLLSFFLMCTVVLYTSDCSCTHLYIIIVHNYLVKMMFVYMCQLLYTVYTCTLYVCFQWNFSDYSAGCKEEYGVTPRPFWVETLYGGKNISASSNIVFRWGPKLLCVISWEVWSNTCTFSSGAQSILKYLCVENAPWMRAL